MKSIYICLGMIVTSFTVFLSYTWYVQYDHTQNVTEVAVKRSLMSTMVEYVDETEFDADDVLTTFEGYLKELALKDYDYTITLNGFIKEPLFMRVHCVVESQDQFNPIKIEVDEAMIEELR